jgi:hypothetical protein
MMDAKEPPGFDENPTRWSRRILIVVLAFAGLCLSAYLTLFQVNVLPSVWDPFFRSKEVLEYLGIPDAALGALAYGAELVLSLIGDRQKWRTMSWTVLAFGIVIVSGALVSVLLILMQAFLVGAWCTLCLASGPSRSSYSSSATKNRSPGCAISRGCETPAARRGVRCGA